MGGLGRNLQQESSQLRKFTYTYGEGTCSPWADCFRTNTTGKNVSIIEYTDASHFAQLQEDSIFVLMHGNLPLVLVSPEEGH